MFYGLKLGALERASSGLAQNVPGAGGFGIGKTVLDDSKVQVLLVDHWYENSGGPHVTTVGQGLAL